jgi:2',3'-cyclic-nucleotide 2'-phosphodiesterase (5'-nucleotidase family)
MLTSERASRLIERRRSVDAYFDSGDCIKAGNLAVPLRQEPVWSVLAELDCTASVIGNRETHILESAFEAKLAGKSHPVLCANLHKKDGSKPLLASLEFVSQGLKVAVFGLMVPMVTKRMRTQAASAYLWDPPLETAAELVKELRPRCDLLIALTHIGHHADRQLAEICPEIDVILGGHSHTVLETPEKVGDTFVCQGGSHCRFVGLYQWNGRGDLSGGLQPF